MTRARGEWPAWVTPEQRAELLAEGGYWPSETYHAVIRPDGPRWIVVRGLGSHTSHVGAYESEGEARTAADAALVTARARYLTEQARSIDVPVPMLCDIYDAGALTMPEPIIALAGAGENGYRAAARETGAPTGHGFGSSAMTAARLKATRERLGLTTDWLARRIDVAERSVHRWEAGQQPVPSGVADEVQRLVAETEGHVYRTADMYRNRTNRSAGPDLTLLTFRVEDDYDEATLTGDAPAGWSASWHRALAAEVARRVTGVTLDYWARGNSGR